MSLSQSVSLQLFSAICIEDGRTVYRMRYLRLADDGSISTDKMLQPAQEPPR